MAPTTRLWFRLISPAGRDLVYDLLVHVLWADGRVSADELSAARAAANAFRMDLTAFPGLMNRSGRPFESLPLRELGPTERPLAYAVAAWMATADAALAVAESATLRRVQRTLELEDALVDLVDTAVQRQSSLRDPLVFLQADERQASLEALLDTVAREIVGLDVQSA